MAYRNYSCQRVFIWVDADEQQIKDWIADFENGWKSVGFEACVDWEGDDLLVANLYGNVKCYPSHSYYDPDEYEYDEIFVDESDPDFIKDEWFKGTPIKVKDVSTKEIEYMGYDMDY